MKKLIVLLAVIYFTLTAFMNSVKANDYGKAVVGHVIQNSSIIDKEELMKQESFVITPQSIVQVECDNLPHRFYFDIVDIKGVFVEDLRQTLKTSDCYLFFNQWLEFFNEKHSPEHIKKVLKEKFNYEDKE